METLNMSSKEISRLEVMQKLSERRMRQKEAGIMLDLSTRQVKRLLKRYKQQGALGLSTGLFTLDGYRNTGNWFRLITEYFSCDFFCLCKGSRSYKR